MTFLAWTREAALSKLQKAIVPPHESAVEHLSRLRCACATGADSESGRALERYLDLCESDKGVRRVMECEDLVRFDLRGVLMRLVQRGLGQWVDNHYAALSTIAHAEPLHYFIEAEKRGDRPDAVYLNLINYWQRSISAQELLASVPDSQVHIHAHPTIRQRVRCLRERVLSAMSS